MARHFGSDSCLHHNPVSGAGVDVRRHPTGRLRRLPQHQDAASRWSSGAQPVSRQPFGRLSARCARQHQWYVVDLPQRRRRRRTRRRRQERGRSSRSPRRERWWSLRLEFQIQNQSGDDWTNPATCHNYEHNDVDDDAPETTPYQEIQVLPSRLRRWNELQLQVVPAFWNLNVCLGAGTVSYISVVYLQMYSFKWHWTPVFLNTGSFSFVQQWWHFNPNVQSTNRLPIFAGILKHLAFHLGINLLYLKNLNKTWFRLVVFIQCNT